MDITDVSKEYIEKRKAMGTHDILSSAYRLYSDAPRPEVTYTAPASPSSETSHSPRMETGLDIMERLNQAVGRHNN